MTIPQKPKRILVADDDLTFRILIEQALLDSGYEVECVNDGDEAQRRVSEFRPDLVLLDNVMPGRTGSEVCRSMCEELGVECPPIVMVTGCDGESEIADAFDAGAQDYLVKPVNWALFKHRVRGWFGDTESSDMQNSKISAQAIEMLVSGHGEIIEIQSLGSLPGDAQPRSLEDFIPEPEVSRVRPMLRRVLRARESKQEEISAEIGGHVASWTLRLDPRGRDKVNLALYESVRGEDSRGQLFRLAYVDSTIGLPNRHLFMQSLKDRLDRAKFSQNGLDILCLTLASLDERQSESLRFVERLGRIGRSIDRVWANEERLQRFEIPGGESFCLASLDGRYLVAIAIADTTPDHRMQHDILSKAEAVTGDEFSLGFGIASYPQDGDTAEVLLDSAIYNAHLTVETDARQGDTPRPRTIDHDSDLEMEVLQGLRSEQLEMHYQPRVDLQTGSVIAAEALVRWIHPMFGSISGGQVLERLASGVATCELTDWAMQEACQQAARWREAGLSLRVTINVADEQLMRGSFDDAVLALMRDLSIPPENLELEVSESVCDLPLHVREQLVELRTAGIGLVIDDFGTGKLRLDTLSQLSPAAFKVDCRNMRIDAGGEDMLGIAGAIAASCGGVLIAKHVETTTDLENARSAGCEQAQGFQICQPLTPPDFAEYVSALTLSETSSLELAAII